MTLPVNNPPREKSAEPGSLLSMVSSYSVDLTVAASEKVCILIPYGWSAQHGSQTSSMRGEMNLGWPRANFSPKENLRNMKIIKKKKPKRS